MTLEKHLVTSSCDGFTRDVGIWSGPQDHSHRLCIFLDAEHYVRDMNCLPVLHELFDSKAIPAMTCVFVSHVSGAARHEDYTCSDRYSRFIAEDIVRWAKTMNPCVTAGGNVICGLSLGGLASAYIAFRYPSVISFVLSQSGSFWWLKDNERLLPPTKARLWLSVGNEETATNVSHPPTGLFQRVSQIEGVESMVKRVEALGSTVRYNLYSGGHAMAPWRDELADALTWLIGTPA